MDTAQMMELLMGIDPMPIVIAAVVGLMFGAIVMLIRTQAQQEDEDAQIINQIEDSFESEFTDNKRQKQNKYWVKWCKYWEKRILGSGVKIPLLTRDNIGKNMVIFFAVIAVACLALFGGQVIAACLVTTLIFIAISFIFGFLCKRKDKIIAGQVPGFLQSMRASVQSNALPQNALMSAIKDSPDELYEELRPLELELTANGNFKDALMRFANTTSFPDLKFLMSCIILSIEKGIDLDPQLGIIQDIVEARRRRQRHIQQAISEIMPTISITSAVMPGIFIFMYVSDKTARDYWWKSVASWLVFIVALAIWFSGLEWSRRQVNAVEALG